MIRMQSLDLFAEWWFWIILLLVALVVAISISRRPRRPKTQLLNNESVVRQYHSIRSLARNETTQSLFSVGRCYVTNQRLIYEGKTYVHGFMDAEPDVVSYPLDELKNIGIVEKGKRDFHIHVGGMTPIHKFVSLTFRGNGEDHQVQIHVRKAEDFRETVQKASQE